MVPGSREAGAGWHPQRILIRMILKLIPILAPFLGILLPAAALAGPYAPRAGEPGSTAIHMDDPRFVAWASGNLAPEYGADVDAIWKTPEKAYDKATDNVYDIVCLGNGGRITMYFPHPVRDGEGADFAVFENSFNDTFLELAFVEVSSDGIHFFRFPVLSDTQFPVGGFGAVDPTNIHGFAGKYRGGYGTPFDLAELPHSPLLDKQRICFIRIVDIIGDGNTKDSRDRPIYDPFPTIGSGGFDLDAIGVIHQNDGAFQVTQVSRSSESFLLEWESNPGSRYRVETSATLDPAEPWIPVDQVAGSTLSGSTVFSAPANPVEDRRFWRVVRLD